MPTTGFLTFSGPSLRTMDAVFCCCFLSPMENRIAVAIILPDKLAIRGSLLFAGLADATDSRRNRGNLGSLPRLDLEFRRPRVFVFFSLSPRDLGFSLGDF